MDLLLTRWGAYFNLSELQFVVCSVVMVAATVSLFSFFRNLSGRR